MNEEDKCGHCDKRRSTWKDCTACKNSENNKAPETCGDLGESVKRLQAEIKDGGYQSWGQKADIEALITAATAAAKLRERVRELEAVIYNAKDMTASKQPEHEYYKLFIENEEQRQEITRLKSDLAAKIPEVVEIDADKKSTILNALEWSQEVTKAVIGLLDNEARNKQKIIDGMVGIAEAIATTKALKIVRNDDGK